MKRGTASKREVNEMLGIRPRPQIPACPDYMSEEAKAEWWRVVPVLDSLGLLTEADGAVLEAYCNSYGNMVTAQKHINTHGVMYESASGLLKQNPAVQVLYASMLAVRAFASLLGLSPAARSRLSIPNPDPEEDEMDRFLRGE